MIGIFEALCIVAFFILVPIQLSLNVMVIDGIVKMHKIKKGTMIKDILKGKKIKFYSNDNDDNKGYV